jgi:hypothetical protein
MDNINIVERLCEIKLEKGSAGSILNKPIIIIIVAIIECILYDFVRKVSEHSQEVIPGIDNIIINQTKNKTLDKLDHLITYVKKHKLMGDIKNNTIYQDLDNLRKLRNRLHIQNQHQELDRNEYKIWNQKNFQMATNTLERVISKLCNVHPRPNRALLSMDDFPRPWQH